MSLYVLAFLVGLAIGIAGTVESEVLWTKFKAKVKSE